MFQNRMNHNGITELERSVNTTDSEQNLHTSGHSHNILGNFKQEEADSPLNNTISHNKHLYPFSKCKLMYFLRNI